ncbi:DUF6522 family protein [Phaeovulum sp.]|uniref:DUF6522 family protein n=1 Tax=Phaeovulum sp. TaxID=2934796 RepID=UPI0039E6B1D1
MSDVSITAEGFEVDAAVLAAAFDLDPEAVRIRMREGKITSRCETGVEEDAGRFRLTFLHHGVALRLTLDDQGNILSRATFPKRSATA